MLISLLGVGSSLSLPEHADLDRCHPLPLNAYHYFGTALL